MDQSKEIKQKHGVESALEERLAEHPHLKARIKSIMDVIENRSGEYDRADDAEQKLIEELREMGNQALHSWGLRQEEIKTAESVQQKNRLKKDGKKKSFGKPPMEQS